MNVIHIGCPCCSNKRLFDLDPVSYGGVTIGIKCPRCKAVVAVKVKDKHIRAEQIATQM